MAIEQSNVDLLMSIDPLELSAKDVNEIIAYHRANRAKLASGGKIAKPTRDTGGPKISISEALGELFKAPAAPTIRRR